MDRPIFWRSLVGAGAVGLGFSLLAGCAPSSEVLRFKLADGLERQLVFGRNGVEFGDCGTQQVAVLYDENSKFIEMKSERGEALHCPLLGVAIQSGAHVGAATIIGSAAQRAAKAAASASNSLTITNNNEGYVGGEYSNNISQTQTQSALGGNGGESIPPPPPPTQTPPGGHKPKGNNGFGNGGSDGSPNGKQDHTR